MGSIPPAATKPVVILTCLQGDVLHTVQHNRFDVLPVLCRRPEPGSEFRLPGGDDHLYDYWRGLNHHWESSRTIVNIEHDVERSADLIVELLDCEHPLCSRPYWIYRASNPRQEQEKRYGQFLHSQGWHSPITNHTAWWATGYQEVAEGDEWADWSAVGFIKIEPRARVSPLGRDTWRGIEQQIAESVSGQWHLHWPAVDHDHKTPRGTE